MELSIRDWDVGDVDRIVGYFLDAGPDDFDRMGVDPAKLPDRTAWREALVVQLGLPLRERERHYQIWHIDGEAVGHSNVSEVEFGVRANMHLHMWEAGERARGRGTELVRLSIHRHFELFDLLVLLCEPHALNPAPNRTLPKLGFELLETVECTPGPIAFPQQVNRWRLTRERWRALSGG